MSDEENKEVGETKETEQIKRPRGRPSKIEIPDLSKMEIKTEHIQTEEEVKKVKKGRPPKPKAASWKEIKDSDVGKALDETFINVINKSVLKGCEQLEEKDCKVGSAFLYMISYYLPNVPSDHPIMIVMASCAKLGFTVMAKKKNKIIKNTVG